jgi:hypothetical protein
MVEPANSVRWGKGEERVCLNTSKGLQWQEKISGCRSRRKSRIKLQSLIITNGECWKTSNINAEAAKQQQWKWALKQWSSCNGCSVAKLEHHPKRWHCNVRRTAMLHKILEWECCRIAQVGAMMVYMVVSALSWFDCVEASGRSACGIWRDLPVPIPMPVLVVPVSVSFASSLFMPELEFVSFILVC